jgi:hypothetical protein
VAGAVNVPITVVDDDTNILRTLQSLRIELLTRDVGVERAADSAAPAGSKSGALVFIGTLIATAVTPEVVAAVVDTVFDWLRRQPSMVKVKIGDCWFEGSVDPAQRDALVAAFLDSIRKHVP